MEVETQRSRGPSTVLKRLTNDLNDRDTGRSRLASTSAWNGRLISPHFHPIQTVSVPEL